MYKVHLYKRGIYTRCTAHAVCKVTCVHTSNRTLPATRGAWCASDKTHMHAFLSHVFGFWCMLLTHTHCYSPADHVISACDQSALAINSHFLWLSLSPLLGDKSYLKLPPRHFYFLLRSFEVHLLSAALNNGNSELSRRRVCKFSVPAVHSRGKSFLIQLKHRMQRIEVVWTSHSTTRLLSVWEQ